MIESQRSNLGSSWTFLVFTAFQIKDNRHWPAICGLPSPLSTNTRETWPANDAKAPLEAYTGSEKSCHRNQTHDFGARHTVVCDIVMSQQSISGKIIGLILCVWKPVFFSNLVTYMVSCLLIYSQCGFSMEDGDKILNRSTKHTRCW